MEPSNDNELFRQLVHHWEEVEEQAGALSFSYYRMAFEELQAITNQIERTKIIVYGVIRQASQLGRSPEWILSELVFEIQSERLGDRRERLRTELACSGASDEALDLYNERSGRFTSTPSITEKAPYTPLFALLHSHHHSPVDKNS